MESHTDEIYMHILCFQELRGQLDKILEHKTRNPGVTDWGKNTKEGAVMEAILELITTEEARPSNARPHNARPLSWRT